MKNCYGYESFLDVPLPAGEVIKDIRQVRVGDRFLTPTGTIETATPALYQTRIILMPRAKKLYAVCKVELIEGYGYQAGARFFLKNPCTELLGMNADGGDDNEYLKFAVTE